jgi:hypothetical protein
LIICLIEQLWKKGYSPHVLFTTNEEPQARKGLAGRGGRGAEAATLRLPPPDVNAILGLDRANRNDYVTYGCVNPRLDEWIESFGYRKAFGPFSDIMVLCPAWDLAGANFSVGYHGEHKSTETLNLRAWYSTLARVENMLRNPIGEKLQYRP